MKKLIILPVFILSQILSAQVSITLDSSITFQTISGWEAANQSHADTDGDPGGPNPLFPLYKDTLFDLAVNDLGLNRLRLEIMTGSENPVDYWSQWYNAQITYNAKGLHRYEIINDNSNPYLINPAGFHFTQLDFAIDSVVLPIKQRLQTKGEMLYLNLCVVDFGAGVTTGNVNFETDSAEYAEFILAAFQHIQSKYGWYPSSLEIILEPEHHWGFDGKRVGMNLVAAAKRLQANGFTPEFIAPSYSYFQNTLNGIPHMLNVPGILNYVDELSYHCYQNCNIPNFRKLDSIAKAHGLRTSQLEKIGRDYNGLYDDLKYANVSAFQQFTIAYGPNAAGGGEYYALDMITDPIHPKITTGPMTKFLRQYFKFIRRGAVRIQANSSDTVNIAPLSFINTNGTWVVAVKTTAGYSFSISGLPGGQYGIKYTTTTQYDIDLADQQIVQGGIITSSIPGAGVITIYGKGTTTSVLQSSKGEYELRAYPLPLKEFFNYELIGQTQGYVNISVMNLQGKNIIEKLHQQAKGRIYMEDIASGIYFLRVETDRQVYHQKLVKQ